MVGIIYFRLIVYSVITFLNFNVKSFVFYFLKRLISFITVSLNFLSYLPNLIFVIIYYPLFIFFNFLLTSSKILMILNLYLKGYSIIHHILIIIIFQTINLFYFSFLLVCWNCQFTRSDKFNLFGVLILYFQKKLNFNYCYSLDIQESN